jgi:hypothetical protein
LKLGHARSSSLAFATLAVLAWGVTAAAQTPPPECNGLLPNNVIDVTVRPATFKDSESTPDGHDTWTIRGQFVPLTSFEIDLGPEANQQQISVILTRTADDVVLFSKMLGPNDFETYGAANNKWRHAIRAADAGPGDTWRVARIRTSKAPSNPGFLNRLKFSFQGVFEPPLELVDQDGPVPMRVTLKIEPTTTTCAAEPSLCLCATYPLACNAGPNGTLRCFSAPS